MGGAEGVREALAAGLALVRRAWREAWAPLAVSAAGWTAVGVAARAALPEAAAHALAWTGLALVLLMAAPKLGALHRLAAGGEARDPVGDAGLQLTPLDGRLAATAVALAACAVLTFAAIGVAAGALPALLRPLGAEALAPPLLLAAAAAACVAVGRLCVTLAADAAEPSPRFARGWILTRGAGAAAGAVWLATCAAPLAGLLATQAALDGLGLGARQPLAATLVAAAGAALSTQFVFAPLNAGALAQLRRAGLARAAVAEAVDTPGPLGDKAGRPPSAASPPEPLAP